MVRRSVLFLSSIPLLLVSGCDTARRDRICIEPAESEHVERWIRLRRVPLDEKGFRELDSWLRGVPLDQVVQVYDNLARICDDCPQALVHGALAVLERDATTGRELARLVIQRIGDYDSPAVRKLREAVGSPRSTAGSGSPSPESGVPTTR